MNLEELITRFKTDSFEANLSSGSKKFIHLNFIHSLCNMVRKDIRFVTNISFDPNLHYARIGFAIITMDKLDYKLIFQPINVVHCQIYNVVKAFEDIALFFPQMTEKQRFIDSFKHFQMLLCQATNLFNLYKPSPVITDKTPEELSLKLVHLINACMVELSNQSQPQLLNNSYKGSSCCGEIMANPSNYFLIPDASFEEIKRIYYELSLSNAYNQKWHSRGCSTPNFDCVEVLMFQLKKLMTGNDERIRTINECINVFNVIKSIQLGKITYDKQNTENIPFSKDNYNIILNAIDSLSSINKQYFHYVLGFDNIKIIDLRILTFPEHTVSEKKINKAEDFYTFWLNHELSEDNIDVWLTV